MPQYKLTYFTTTGIAEMIRFILSYADQDFEDVRYTLAMWPEKKPNTPYGTLPTLEIDGKIYNQSLAIGRYLANEYNLAGKNNLENLEIDSIVDTISEFRILFTQFLWEPNAEEKAKKREILVKEKIPFYMGKFDEQVKNNGGYFINGRVTWADLFFVSLKPFFEVIIRFDPIKDYKNLNDLADKILAIPNIKKWVDKRPTACCLTELFYPEK